MIRRVFHAKQAHHLTTTPPSNLWSGKIRQACCLQRLTFKPTVPVGVPAPVGSVTDPVTWLWPPAGVVLGLSVPAMTVCTGAGCTDDRFIRW